MKNKEPHISVFKRNDIVFLEGKQTIAGQIRARQKALYHCLQPNTTRVFPNLLEAWTQEHVRVLRKLYALAKRHGIKTKP